MDAQIVGLRRKLLEAGQAAPCPACRARVPAQLAKAAVLLAARAATCREELGTGDQVDGALARNSLRDIGHELLQVAETVLRHTGGRRHTRARARR